MTKVCACVCVGVCVSVGAESKGSIDAILILFSEHKKSNNTHALSLPG